MKTDSSLLLRCAWWWHFCISLGVAGRLEDVLRPDGFRVPFHGSWSGGRINNKLHTTTIFKLWENGLSNHCCCIIRLKILKIQIMIFLCFDFILAALPTGPSTAQFNILHDNKNLTRLSPAASPVRNSLNGGNCLNRSSTGRDSHGGPCHKSLISLSREIKLKKTE